MKPEKNELEPKNGKISLRDKLKATGLFLFSVGVITSAIIQAERSTVRDEIRKGTGVLLKKEDPKQDYGNTVEEISDSENSNSAWTFSRTNNIGLRTLLLEAERKDRDRLRNCLHKTLSYTFNELLAQPEINFRNYLTEYKVAGDCFTDIVEIEDREAFWNSYKNEILKMIIADGYNLGEITKKLDLMGLTIKELAIGTILKLTQPNLDKSL